MRLQIGNETVEVNLPDFNGKAVGGAIIAILVVIAGFTSFYTIQPEEEGVVLRFGKHVKNVPPGLHFRVPYGIDSVYKVPVRRQLKQEFGFGTRDSSNRWQSTSPQEMESEKTMVSGDLNSALVEWVIQYRITEPEDYLFKVRNADATLRDASESVMREVVGDRTVDEVITVGRQEIESESNDKLKALVKLYQMGITIDQVQLKDVNPPKPVQASFNEVNQAQQEKEQSINIANGEYNRAVPKASGEAEKMISEAEGYVAQRVNEAEGDAARFTSLFAEYQKAPEVTRRRIYLETMETVMPRVGNKVIIDESANQVLPFLPLHQTGSAAK